MPATATRRSRTAFSGDGPGGFMGGQSGDSTPPSPLEKYFTLKDSYLRAGKAWEWVAMRDAILAEFEAKGWPLNHWTLKQLLDLMDTDSEVAPERRAELRRGDAELEQELKTMRARAEAASFRQGNGDQKVADSRDELVTKLIEQNAALMAQMTALMADRKDEPDPIALPEAAKAPQEAKPSIMMSKTALLGFADVAGIAVSSHLRGSAGSKADILETINGALAEREETP